MKKLFLLLFSLLFSFNSYGEWVLVTTTTVGDKIGSKIYVDKDTIKKKDGFTYNWELSDFSKTWSSGSKSAKTFIQSDCSLYRRKVLSMVFYNNPMGKGEINFSNQNASEWQYPPPNSNGHNLIKYVCNAR